MRSKIFVIGLLVIIALPLMGFAQEKADPAVMVGTWVISQEGRNGETRESEWTFAMKEGKLVLTLPAMGGRRGGGGGEPPEIEDIKFDGKKLTFEMERGRGERTMIIEYEIELKDKDNFEGNMIMGERGERPFTGIRKKK